LEAAAASVVQDHLDWDTVNQIVRREGLAPLLYQITRGQDLFPPQIKEGMHSAYYRNAHRNLLLFHQLEHVLSHLTQEGVPAILLKGAALTEVVYSNVAVRPMGDLDLLVRRKDVDSALQVLMALGYQPATLELCAGYFITYRNHVQLIIPEEEKAPVEIHWSLFGPSYYYHAVSMDWFWQTALPVHVGGVTAWVLGSEAQLLHLCAHILQHGGLRKARLIWLYDLAEVVAFYREQIHWDLVLACAQGYHLVLAVREVLNELSQGWKAPIPAPVLEQLRALRASRNEERAFARLTTAHRPVQNFWANLGAIRGWRARLGFIRCVALPSANYMQYRYRIPHRLLLPFYYPYRWLRSLRDLSRCR